MTSSLMIKLIADFLKITPEDVNKMIDEGRGQIAQALNYLQGLDERLNRIENALNIKEPEIIELDVTSIVEGSVNAEKPN